MSASGGSPDTDCRSMPDPDGQLTNRDLSDESIDSRTLANAVTFDTSVQVGTTGTIAMVQVTPTRISLTPNTTIAAAKPALIRAVSVGATGTTDEVLRLLFEAPTLDGLAGAGTQISLDSESASDTFRPAIVFRYTGTSTARPRVFIDDNYQIRMTTGVTLDSDNLGSSTAPVLGIGTNYDDGIYSPANGELAFTLGGQPVWRMTNPSTRVGRLYGLESNDYIEIDGNNETFRVAIDDAIELELSTAEFTVPNVFGTTNAGSANVVVTSTGGLAKVASALKYKPGWSYSTDLADRQLPRPILWPTDTGGQVLGYGAEHVAAYVPEAASFEQYHLAGIVAVLQDKIERLEERYALDST